MCNPKSEPFIQSKIDEKPFTGMEIRDPSILDRLEGRQPCPKCGKSRKYFCYTCYLPIAELKGQLPRIKLPLKIDIIKHKHEIDGKSTAAHAALLAPDDVRVFTYPDIPDYDEDGVVLIYPSFTAIKVSQLFDGNYKTIVNIKPEEVLILPKGYNKSTLMTAKQKTNPEISCTVGNFTVMRQLPVKRAVFIDSTWNQSKGIYKDERIRKLLCVVLQNRISQFWRHQKGSPRWYLATVEAIHQFLVEVHLCMWGLHPEYNGVINCFSEDTLNYIAKVSCAKNTSSGYCGQYDNLLFFFKYMYDLIHAYYDHDNLFAYKRRLL